MIDYSQVNTIITEAFEATADKFAEAQIDAMEAYVYDWDTTTYRKSGEVVDSPRDIVDTGELRDSLTQLYGVGLRVYMYLASHAAEVHEGYINEFGNAKPARPWTRVAREMFIDLELTMAQELSKRL
ncbi:MAG: hypothetical protein ACRC2S_28615 [Waterburya sp.]